MRFEETVVNGQTVQKAVLAPTESVLLKNIDERQFSRLMLVEVSRWTSRDDFDDMSQHWPTMLKMLGDMCEDGRAPSIPESEL